jgi:prepilin-type N-terminal cleavage/methylation domain-containing protein
MKCGVRTAQAGFSLAEMMVVILIGGILTTLAIPNFAQMRQGYRLRGAAREVFLILQRARMAAMKENTNYRIYIAGTSIVVHDDFDSDNVEDTGETITTTNLQSDFQGVSFSNGPSSTSPLVFLPNGMASSAITVTVRNSAGKQQQVSVALGGRVRIAM